LVLNEDEVAEDVWRCGVEMKCVDVVVGCKSKAHPRCGEDLVSRFQRFLLVGLLRGTDP
jgi:hypothetical protein